MEPAYLHLDPVYALGYTNIKRTNVVALPSGAIMYPSGIYLIVEYRGKVINILPTPKGTTSILFTELTANKRYLLLVTRSCQNTMCFYIYRLANYSLLSQVFLEQDKGFGSHFVHAGFSCDDSMIYIQLGHPDYQTLVWLWRESQLTASKQNQMIIKKLLPSPVDPTSLLLLSTNTLYLWRLRDRVFVTAATIPFDCASTDCEDAIWLRSGGIAVLTKNGDILFVEEQEVRACLTSRIITQAFPAFANSPICSMAADYIIRKNDIHYQASRLSNNILLATANGCILTLQLEYIKNLEAVVSRQELHANTSEMIKAQGANRISMDISRDSQLKDGLSEIESAMTMTAEDEGPLETNDLEISKVNDVTQGDATIDEEESVFDYRNTTDDMKMLLINTSVKQKCNSLPLRVLFAPRFAVLSFYHLHEDVPIVKILKDFAPKCMSILSGIIHVFTKNSQVWEIPNEMNIRDAEQRIKEEEEKRQKKQQKEKDFSTTTNDYITQNVKQGEDELYDFLQSIKKERHVASQLAVSCIASCNTNVYKLAALMTGSATSVVNINTNWLKSIRGLKDSELVPFTFKQMVVGPGKYELNKHKTKHQDNEAINNSDFNQERIYMYGVPLAIPDSGIHNISSATALPLTAISYTDGSIVIVDYGSDILSTRTCLTEEHKVPTMNDASSNNVPDSSIKISILVQTKINTGPAFAVMHPCGKYVAVAAQRTFTVYSLSCNSLTLITELQTKQCNIAAFSSDGGYLAYADGPIVECMNFRLLEHLCTITSHTNTITCLQFSNTEYNKLLTASLDGRIYIHDICNNCRLEELILDDNILKTSLSSVITTLNTVAMANDKHVDNSVIDVNSVVSSISNVGFLACVSGETHRTKYTMSSSFIKHTTYSVFLLTRTVPDEYNRIIFHSGADEHQIAVLLVLKNGIKMIPVFVQIPSDCTITSIALASGEKLMDMLNKDDEDSKEPPKEQTFTATVQNLPQSDKKPDKTSYMAFMNDQTAKKEQFALIDNINLQVNKTSEIDFNRTKRDDKIKVYKTRKTITDISVSNTALKDPVEGMDLIIKEEYLIMGTNTGQILIYSFPIRMQEIATGLSLSVPVWSQQIFSRDTAVTTLSVIGGYLVNIGSDKGEFITHILKIPKQDKIIEASLKGKQEGEQAVLYDYYKSMYIRPPVETQTLLIPKEIHQEHNEILLNLVDRLCELNEQTYSSIKRQYLAHQEKLRELSHVFKKNEKLEHSRANELLQALMLRKQDRQKRLTEITEKYTTEMVNRDTKCQNQIDSLEKKIAELERMIDGQEQEMRIKMEKLDRSYSQKFKVLKQNTNTELDLLRSKENNIKQEYEQINTNSKIVGEIISQEQKDLKQLTVSSYKEENQRTKNSLILIKSEIHLITKQLEEIFKEIYNFQLQISKQQQQIQQQHKANIQLNAQLEQLNMDNKQLNDLINTKLVKIKNLNILKTNKQKLNEVKKFKLTELNNLIKPKTTLLQNLNEQFNKLEIKNNTLSRNKEAIQTKLNELKEASDYISAKNKQRLSKLSRLVDANESLIDKLISIGKYSEKKNWLEELKILAEDRNIFDLDIFKKEREKERDKTLRLREMYEFKTEINEQNQYLVQQLDECTKNSSSINGLNKDKIESVIKENTKMLNEERETRKRIKELVFDIQHVKADIGKLKAKIRMSTVVPSSTMAPSYEAGSVQLSLVESNLVATAINTVHKT